MVVTNKELDQLDQQIENSLQRLEELWQGTEQLLPDQNRLLVKVVEEFSATVEELQVASEELRQQNEELIARRLAVEADRRHYQDLFEFASVGYLVTDASSAILEANRLAANLLNIDRNLLLGKQLLEFIAIENRSSFQTQLAQMQSGAEARSWQIQIQTGHKERFSVAIAVTSVQNSDGRVVGLHWRFPDVTHHQIKETVIQRYRRELQKQLEEQTVQVALNEQPKQEIAERQRAESVWRQQTEWERLMEAMQVRIRKCLNLEDILNTTVAEVRQFLACDRVVIYRVQPSGAGAVLAESVNAAWPSLLGMEIDTSLFRERIAIYRQGNNRVVHDIQQVESPTAINEFLHQLQVKASLTVPISHENQFWGLIAAHECSGARYWQPWEIELLSSVATQVSIAIQQSELYQEIRRVSADLEQQVRERTAQLQQALNFEAMLKRIIDNVRDSLDESQILQTVVQELTPVLSIYGCDSSLYDANHLTATIYYEYAPNWPSFRGRVLQMKEFAEGYAQLVGGDYFQFCELSPSLRGPFTILACPIFDDKGILGDLWLFKPREEAFNDLEIRLVQQVASQCAIAIRQARLYQTSLAQVEELEKLDRLKDDFLSTVSHELRTPIANMKMAIQMLGIALNKDKPLFAELSKPQAEQSKVARYFQILHKECDRESRLIDDLLDLQRIHDVQTLLLTSIHLQDWLPSLAEPFQQRARNNQQTLHLDIDSKLPPLICDSTAVQRIVAELLENACKYTPQGECITVIARGVEGRLELRVANSGVEIPASERNRIFEKFYRIPSSDPSKQGGTGLGLALVQKLLFSLKGTIQVESGSNTTCFTVSLPFNCSV